MSIMRLPSNWGVWATALERQNSPATHKAREYLSTGYVTFVGHHTGYVGYKLEDLIRMFAFSVDKSFK